MGVSFYVTKPEQVASFSYGGFHEFRTRLAKEAGINLSEMDGFVENAVRRGDLATLVRPRSWVEIDDPIKLLLDHSDCDGELTYEECEQIAPRLRELVQRWPEGDFDREQGEALADAMEEAAEQCGEIQFR